MVEKKSKKSSKADKETPEKEDKNDVKRKILFIELDEEVTGVFDSIKKAKEKEVYVVVPKRAILFQSIVNLKILKRKTEELKKNLHIITNDQNGIHLAEQVGLKIHDNLEGLEHPHLYKGGFKEDDNITPLKATINTLDDEQPTRLEKKKLSISELLGRDKKKKVPITVEKIQKPEREKEKKDHRLVLIAPNRQALIALIVVTVLVLLTIVYIALPGATIYLIPKTTVLEQSTNVTFADFETNRNELDTHPPHMIASYPVDIDLEKTLTHFSTGKNFQGQNASGKITIYNKSNHDWALITETRFQTPDGLVFRIKNPVNVRGGSSLEADVVADSVDAYGQITGDRGNIGPTTFILPALRESSQKLIYAESKAPMNGGVTSYLTIVTEDDVEAATNRLSEELKKAAEEALETEVLGKNKMLQGETSFNLLKGSLALHIGEPKITVPDGVVGLQIDQFDITGSISASGIYYNRDEMMEILKAELMLKKSPEKKIVKINEDSLTYRIFDINEDSEKVKITATIKGLEVYEISPDKENGARLIKKIKDHILGKDIAEAERYIQNLPEINKVQIKSWPAWALTIPSVPDNIKIEVAE
ncbi:hypothetical protein KKG51_00035 [Patescibacteria group bacterium]|nr:hypothetical protein [Patescibacteria group bacterium]